MPDRLGRVISIFPPLSLEESEEFHPDG
jgi:hypothetical protein